MFPDHDPAYRISSCPSASSTVRTPLAEIGASEIDHGIGDDVLKLFTYAREKGFAIPAVNVTSSSTVVAALEAARDAKAPIMYDDSNLPPVHLWGNMLTSCGLACKQARVVLPTSPARASRTAPRSRRRLLVVPSLPPTTSAPSLLCTASPSSVGLIPPPIARCYAETLRQFTPTTAPRSSSPGSMA